MAGGVLLGLRAEGYLDLVLNEPARAADNPKSVRTGASSLLACAHHVTGSQYILMDASNYLN